MTQSKYERTREHRTRWTVRVADRIAGLSITVGGIGTILAVSAVGVFLVAVAIPIFLPGTADEVSRAPYRAPGAPLLYLAADEYRTMGWTMLGDGTVHLFRLDTGEEIEAVTAAGGDSLSAWSFAAQGDDVALGYVDGTVRLGRIGFDTDFPDVASLPPAAAALAAGEVMTVDGGVVERTSEGQLRRQRLVVEFGEALDVGQGAAIALLDHFSSDGGSIVCALGADGRIHVDRVERFDNWMTGETEYEVSGGVIEADLASRGGRLPDDIAVAESGNYVYAIWRDGAMVACDTRDLASPRVAGTADLEAQGGAEVTQVATLLGGATFLVGDSGGRVGAWFRHRALEDGREVFAFSRSHRYAGGKAPVTALSSSPRTRVFAAGYADGRIRVFQATSGATILEMHTDDAKPVVAVSIAPKNDGVVAVAGSTVYHWRVDLRYPEATLESLFLPVWYEGYDGPAFVWQSSSGTDDFEPKFGLWPLVFGTLKATVYSMIFGVPLALLAAIFTSEFLSPAIRPHLKSLVESMASLPSVVLGFLAALVFAPFVQRVVPAALTGFVVIPGSFLVGAYLWQLLPQEVTLRLERFRLWILLALLPAGVLVSALLGPAVERLLFGGDVIAWLDGRTGSGFGGWVVLLLAPSAVFIVWLAARPAGGFFARLTRGRSRARVALLDLARFVAGVVATLAVTSIASGALTALGADPRGPGSFFDTYVQRNALVVGFVMGFAIIPIIYTIAEDALSAVPEHLRAASLGAGATPWQTAIRVVLPAAMSGLFSAVMIGLGRAVGETMIVLMAAGNTPILDVNIFNGFRTLSANIAVELPEAVRNSTHYRTLFLAALILFSMTFVINTVAEIVRLRFRRRSAQI